MADYTIVSFDDWQALYCDQRKALEGHSLPLRDVLEVMGVPCEHREATPEYVRIVEDCGIVPEKLGDYPKGSLE